MRLTGLFRLSLRRAVSSKMQLFSLLREGTNSVGVIPWYIKYNTVQMNGFVVTEGSDAVEITKSSIQIEIKAITKALIGSTRNITNEVPLLQTP